MSQAAPPPPWEFREQPHGDSIYEIDLRPQVLRLSLPEDRDFGGTFEEGEAEAPLVPSPDQLGWSIPSAALLGQKAKLFDDGLYAAVELGAQEGAGSCPGKAAWLRGLAARLIEGGVSGDEEGVARFLAAVRLGGGELELDVDLANRVEALAEDFLSDPLRSKPIAFYSWSEALGRIFRQDRLLQARITDETSRQRLAALVEGDEDAAVYQAFLRLPGRLTNPFAGDPLGAGSRPSFLPPSRAHETELIKRLYGDSPIPEGFELATEMIRRVRAGDLDLSPVADSGWYDHQTHALAALLEVESLPEGERLELEESYRAGLEEVFRALLTLTRETHIKQLEIPCAGGVPAFTLRPELAVEPLPSHYARRAAAYAFVREVLFESFGEELGGLRRVGPDGPVEPPLAEELRGMERLFRGAAAAACCDLGLDPAAIPGTGEDPLGDRKAFLEWAGGMADDPDLGRDVRCQVPVYYDVERKTTRVWCFLGWTSRLLQVDFARRPKVRRRAAGGVAGFLGNLLGGVEEPDEVEFEATGRNIAYPVMAEADVNRILDRDEFRALCDEAGTRSEILRRLQE